jgi:MFS transporter, DHA1 family, inner membrane transport protein
VNNTEASALDVSAARREQAGTRSVAITMYCILLLSYVLMAADRYLFPVIAPYVRREFSFSPQLTGLLTTIFTLGLGVGGLTTGYILSRFSRKAVMLTGIAIFSGATALTTVTQGFWGMLLCLAAQGIGMAMLATSMFALAASYFVTYKAAAIGSVNFCYGIGGFVGSSLAGVLLTRYMTWRAPMIAFGLFGFVMIAVVVATVRSWFSETRGTAQAKTSGTGGALSLWNRNTVLLTILSVIHGLSMYGFLGGYASFLQENLHYAPTPAGVVVGFFAIGALASIAGGWLGDRFSPRIILSTSYVCIAVLGYLFFLVGPSAVVREILACIYGIVGSAILYVGLAAYHVRSLRSTLASKGSGMFVTSLYGGAAFGGYLIRALASHGGWLFAGVVQMSVLCAVGAILALAVRPSEMNA